MIIVNGVTKFYGKVSANDHVSLTALPGELVVLLGPNGAGKSTLIKSICGLLRFQGSISIGGYPNTSSDAKRLLGYVPEMPALYPMLTIYEHLEFIAKAYRLENWKHRADSLLERFELSDKRKKLGKELSKGMQQKVSICCAVLPEPKAVIFDEPLVGLDPHGIRELKLLINNLKQQGCALIISTHMIESMENNWDTTYIMMKGRVAHVCKRSALDQDINLEKLYFQITEECPKENPVDENRGELDA